MDLRVYVDGVARIICDLTRTTTVHDIIIALAQYKGQAGRYSLLERSPDGIERTLSPNELAFELQHPDWIYILQQNPSTNDQKRSKSLDERRTSSQQQSSTFENPPAVTSFSSSSPSSSPVTSLRQQHRTVHSSTKSIEKKKRPSIHQLFPSANLNNNNNNELTSFFIEQKRCSRAPIQIIEQDFGTFIDQNNDQRRPRSKSHLSLSKGENSAFQLVHQKTMSHQQQQQYLALLKMLKTQETQVEQQQRQLHDKQEEIDFREKILHNHLIESDRSLNQELDEEFHFHQQLTMNLDRLQEQFQRCSTTLEKKRLLQDQIQMNIEEIHHEIDDVQNQNRLNQKDIHQTQHDLERCNSTISQQDDLVYVLSKRNHEIERLIEQRRQQINQLENELIQLDDQLLNNLIHPTFEFRPNVVSTPPSHYTSCPSSTATDSSTPIRLQFVNNTLWKLCPSGIWV